MLTLHGVLSGLWLFGLVASTWGTVYTIWRMNFSKLPRRWAPGLPPISILKPIKGVDPSLKENLESFKDLDYPVYEVILAVADWDDPALDVVHEVMSRCPYGPFRLITGDTPIGSNPKVNNLVKPEKGAIYDTVLISDSNIRAHKNYLHETVSLFRDERNGIITAPIHGYGGIGIGGSLEEMHLNTFYLRSMCLGKSLGQVFVMGKSMMYSRKVAARFGGIASCANYINEDYMMGVLMQHVGKRIELSNRPIHQYVGGRTFKEFWMRHYRWSVIQKRVVPLVYAAHPLQFAAAAAALAAYALPFLWWQGALLSLGACYTLDSVLLLSCRGRPTPYIWLLRELLLPAIWLHALFSNKIIWRGHTLTIKADGLAA